MVMQGAEQQVDQQKAALLSVIAQQGQQGQAAFQGEAQRRAQGQAAAQAGIASQATATNGYNAPAALTSQLQAQQNMLGSIYAQDAAMSQGTFNNSMALTDASNAAYMDQARAGVGVVRGQTQGIIEQIKAQKEAEEAERRFQAEQREFERQQRELDAQLAREEMAFAREEMQHRRSEREVQRKGETEEDFLERVAEKQTRVLTKAQRELDPALAGLLDDVTSISDNPAQALEVLARDIKRAEDAGEQIPGFRSGSRLDLAKRVYEYYTLKPAPNDIDKLEEALSAEGASVRTIMPSYLGLEERNAKKFYETVSARDRAQRGQQAGHRLTGKIFGALERGRESAASRPAERQKKGLRDFLTGGVRGHVGLR